MEEKGEFIGLPDDIARIAIQRLMSCDCRWRGHALRAKMWNKVAIWVSVTTAVSASLAAVSYVNGVLDGAVAITLSIVVAIVAPLQTSLGPAGHAKTHNDAAFKFELLANDYERFIQLDLGPPMWEKRFENLQHLRNKIDLLDAQLASITSNFPRIRTKEGELAATEVRGQFLVDYLQMKNVVVPSRPIWTH